MFRYFGGRYLAWVVASGVGLTIVVSLIHAVELARRSSTKQTAEDINVLNLVLLNIPTVIETTLPIVLIIGSMVCFESWNRTNEFVVSRGFGKSIWSVLSPVAVAAFLIGVGVCQHHQSDRFSHIAPLRKHDEFGFWQRRAATVRIRGWHMASR